MLIRNILWLTLVAHWIHSAWGNKRTVHRVNPIWRLAGVTGIVALVVVVMAFPDVFRARFMRHSEAAEWAWMAISSAGIATAIQARHTLGKNWRGTPTIKEGRELVESGSCRYVRHPTYTGILTGIVRNRNRAMPD